MNTNPKGCTNQSINNGITSDPNAKFSVQVITSEAEFDTLETHWNELHQLSLCTGLFNTWHWNRIWWQHYGQRGSLHVLVVKIQQRIVGIAPLYQTTSQRLRLVKAKTLQFIGSGGDTSPDDLGILCHPDYELIATTAICKAIFNTATITRIHLSDLDNNSLLCSVLTNSAKAEGWNPPLKTIQDRLVDTLPISIDDFEQQLSRNARKQRKRRRNKLAEAGEICFTFSSTPEQVIEAYDALIRLHHKRFAAKGGSDAFATSNYREFHLAVMFKALERHELKLLTLKIDGAIVGVEYAFLCKDTLSFFQTGFDPDFQHLSLGHILMMHTIDQGIIDGAKSIDLLKGDYPYKTTYAKQNKTTVRLDFWQSKLVIALIKLLDKVRS